MQSEDSNGFEVEPDPVAKTWDYVVTTIKPDDANAVAADDIDIPVRIIWDLSGGHGTGGGGSGTAGPAHRDRIDSCDHETREDLVGTGGPSDTEGNGLPDFIVRDDDDDSGDPDTFEWIAAAGDTGAAGLMKWEYLPPIGDTGTILDFDVDDTIEAAPFVEMWADLA